MTSVQIGINESQLAEIRKLLNPKQFQQAIYQAVKRTTSKGTTIVRDKMKAATFINTKYVRRAVTTKMESGETPVGIVNISQHQVPLIGYRVNVSKRGGAIAQASRDRPPLIFRHAFKGKIRNRKTQDADEGHIGIFLRRKSDRTKSGFVARLPIDEVLGPSVLSLVEAPKMLSEVETILQDELEKQVQSQVDRFTK